MSRLQLVTVVPAPLMQPTSMASQPSNPYQRAGGRHVSAAPTAIDAGNIMSRAWEIYKDQMGKCILVLFAATMLGRTPRLRHCSRRGSGQAQWQAA